MSEMAERIAKAMAEAINEPMTDDHRQMARAAIEAMREPTPAIWDAMAQAYQTPACMWMAGIDAALK